jgi:hypothetical protein
MYPRLRLERRRHTPSPTNGSTFSKAPDSQPLLLHSCPSARVSFTLYRSLQDQAENGLRRKCGAAARNRSAASRVSSSSRTAVRRLSDVVEHSISMRARQDRARSTVWRVHDGARVLQRLVYDQTRPKASSSVIIGRVGSVLAHMPIWRALQDNKSAGVERGDFPLAERGPFPRNWCILPTRGA